MENTFLVTELFRQAFGLNIPFFITEDFKRNAPLNLSFEGVEMLPDYYDATSATWMGTPVLFGATFKGGIYQEYNLAGEIIDRELQDLTLPPATMFSFRRAKNITRTNVLGSNGTVKEIFGFDDWIIDVRGLCLDEPNRSAQEQFDALLKFEKLADAIDIEGQLFSQRSIQRVCINEWNDNIPQSTPGVVAFSFQLISDEPMELVISKL